MQLELYYAQIRCCTVITMWNFGGCERYSGIDTEYKTILLRRNNKYYDLKNPTIKIDGKSINQGNKVYSIIDMKPLFEKTSDKTKILK